MRAHAILDQELVVIEIQNIDESQILEKSRSSMVIDIEDLIPQPQLGWKLDGNKLVPPVEDSQDVNELDRLQQTSQRLFGLKLLTFAVDKIGARNLKLAREGTPANVATLASAMASMKLLLEGGALKTVRTLCDSVKGNFPSHEDILQDLINQITTFLTENGWE